MNAAGLSGAEAARRLQEDGPNTLPLSRRRRWRKAGAAWMQRDMNVHTRIAQRREDRVKS